MNRVIFTGNMGRDPEMRYTEKGDAVTNFSMAVYRGQDVDPIWLKISCWGDLAERVNSDCHKGDKVLVEGYLMADDDGGPKMWEDKNGDTRASFDVTATWVEYLSKRDNGDDEEEGEKRSSRRSSRKSEGREGRRSSKGSSRSSRKRSDDEEEQY